MTLSIIGQEVTAKHDHRWAVKQKMAILLDDFESQREEAADDLVAVLQLQTHVEGFDVGQVLQQVEVAFEGRVFGVLQTSQLLYQEHEDSLKRNMVETCLNLPEFTNCIYPIKYRK